MHGLPCIICKRKLINNAHVFLLNREKQSFNAYSLIGSIQEKILITLFKIHQFTLYLNIFFINFTEENCVNDKLRYNKNLVAQQNMHGFKFKPMAFCQINLLYIYIYTVYLLYYFLFSSFHGLDVWSFGLQIHGVTRTLAALSTEYRYRAINLSTLKSQLCSTDSLLII